MKELDVIKLKKDLPKHNLKKGQKGTVVMLYGDPVEDVEVEFDDGKTGRALALVQLPVDCVEVIWEYKEELEV